MAKLSPETLYKIGLKKIDLLDVITTPEEYARICRRVQNIMTRAGDYLDAPEIAKEYEAKAEETLLRAKQEKYDKALSILQQAKNVADYDRGLHQMQELKTFSDARGQFEHYRAIKRKYIQKNNIIRAMRTMVVIIVVAFIYVMGSKWLERKDAIRLEKAAEERGETQNIDVSLSNASLGDEILFGKYKWKVLELDGEKATLMVINPEKFEELTEVSFHDTDEAVNWEGSAVRSWLNNEFLEENFVESERERILVSELENSDNSLYGTAGGNDTKASVYLLSENEAEHYWALLKKVRLNWLLRSPGNSENAVQYVSADHRIREYGCSVTDQYYLRPVIQVTYTYSGESIPDLETSLANAEPGDAVKFGKYRWTVLDVDEEAITMIVLSVDAYEELLSVSYHDTEEAVDWEHCSIREWLNGDFLDATFTDEERALILNTKVKNDPNSEFGTPAGNDTEDFVYLLSEAEAEEYSEVLQEIGWNWLLRSPGNTDKAVQFVSSDHKIRKYGCGVTEETYIRPVVRVALPSAE